METREAIVYREAERAITTQIAAFDELRARTGLLLAATTVTASFLGSETLKRDGIQALNAVGLGMFIVAIAACLYVLWPRQNVVKFVLKPTVLLEGQGWKGYAMPKFQRQLALRLQTNHGENQKKLDKLYIGFQVATIAVGLEVVLWTLQLAIGG